MAKPRVVICTLSLVCVHATDILYITNTVTYTDRRGASRAARANVSEQGSSNRISALATLVQVPRSESEVAATSALLVFTDCLIQNQR
ncbi:hypothetical protein [Mycobacterium colombiense]|uniref:hypothetical protein n=1 Tax=Mycobacterium colombiense TaxID=339268 RepID=UPI0005C99362|nr:hypothetical protein [Mycobacterium colombiense]